MHLFQVLMIATEDSTVISEEISIYSNNYMADILYYLYLFWNFFVRIAPILILLFIARIVWFIYQLELDKYDDRHST